MNLKHKPTHTRPAFLNPANSASRFRFSALVFLVPAMLLLGFAGWRVNARRATALSDNSQTHSRQNGLAAALNPDGTLRPGANGSFDTNGFRMEYTATGAPRFVPAAQQTACSGWDTQFSLPNGIDGYVSALAVSGSDLYVGGRITFVGKISVNNIAKFNTTTGVWSALGTGGGNGVNAEVRALAVIGNDLYVGGYFTSANIGGSTVNVNRVAKVNTTTSIWSKLGTDGNGVSQGVSVLTVIGSDLYVGGYFTMANAGGTTVSANHVVKFNTLTNAWTTLGVGGGSGVSGEVRSLALSGNDLYVGGDFTTANVGGTVITVNNVAKFNTITEIWTPLGIGGGSGVDLPVNALAVIGNDLYVAGSFSVANVGGTTANARYLAKVDTVTGTWSAIGMGMGTVVSSSIETLAAIGSNLYAGGSFTMANVNGVTVRVNRVIRYNTMNAIWSGLGTNGGNGVDGPVASLTVSEGNLYVGGSFTSANVGGLAVSTRNLATFDALSGIWNGVGMSGNGMTGAVYAIAVSGTDIYVGGAFSFASNIAANHLAKFNTLTKTWSPLGTGGGNGISGGDFPSTFDPPFVTALAVIGSDLYVGGRFTMANVGGTTVNANNVAKYNTLNGVWSALGTGSGNGVAGLVYALATIGSDLYVGGSFATANVGGTVVRVNSVAKFNTITSIWSAIGTGNGKGVNGSVQALAVIDSDLYVGGGFGTANVGGTTVSANNIAKVNTLTNVWSRLGAEGGNGVDDLVFALAVSGSDLYVGGAFWTVRNGSTTINAEHLARFNTTTSVWNPLGTGVWSIVGGDVYALVVIGSDLYVGGHFLSANAGGTSINAKSVAKYNTTSRVWGALADAGGGNGVNGTVVALAVMAGNLYVGGDFTVVGDNKPSLSIGRYAALEITAVADLTRVAGGLGSNSPIATVGQSGSAFAVSINGGASATVNGVTVSGLSINAAGQVTANIVAAANATSANFTLRVSDCAGLFSEATLTITVVKFSGTVTDPLVCTGPGNTVAVTLVLGNSGATPLNVGDKTTFTNLVGMPGTCTVTPNVGTCTVTNANLTYSATLAANQTVMLNYLTQVADNVAPGAQVCTNNVATFGTNSGTISSGGITFDDSGPISLQVCGTVNCPAAGPGLPVSAASPVNDQKAGSVLVYNVYTSASDPTRQNTRIALTNTHPTRSTAVHLFFVDGTSCSVADANVCLTANQTTIFQASDLDPGTTGYIVAVAVGADGCPINFNYLIGDEYVKFAGGHAANLGAEAIAALAGGLPSCNANSVTAQLNFDGVSYNQVPRALALDNVPSRADGNDTMLILNRFGGNLGIGAGTLINLFGIFYDDSEKSVSFGFGGSSSSPGTCQFRSSLSNAFPRVTPRFETFISAGRSGWARIYSQSDIGLLGAVLNFNPNAGTNGGAFTGGHNLHKLTLTSAMSLTIPILPPSC